MRIAIIGAGVSGLTSAYLLARLHEITVFEASDHPGGHANTIRVDTAHETHHLDTGFVVFNDRNYPNFEKLIALLRVDSQPSDMSFSVSDGVGNFEYSSGSLSGLFANPRNLVSASFHRMLADVPRFQRAARELLRSGDDRVSLRDWLRIQGFSTKFVERLIVPQVAAVWSADSTQLWSFPARFLAQFFENHGMLQLHQRPRWRTITGGSARYVEALTAGFSDRIRLRTPVQQISRCGEQIVVQPRGSASEQFDHVVVATHADQALAMLSDASDSERAILGAIPYQPNEAILHTDTSVLPRRPRAWASWNFQLRNQGGPAAVTYHLNRLQAIASSEQYCLSLNMRDSIDPGRVLRRIQYAHPVYTPDGVTAQRRATEISGRNRTHFCGAYWGWGFHEDGVMSALRVAEHFGVRL